MQLQASNPIIHEQSQGIVGKSDGKYKERLVISHNCL